MLAHELRVKITSHTIHVGQGQNNILNSTINKTVFLNM